MPLVASVKLLKRQAFCTAALASASLWGGVVFTDNTFNTADYSTITWKSDPGIGIKVQQTQTGGNPGQALQILYTLPAISGNSMLGLTRPSFTYDPAIQGAIQSIDFSLDKYNTFTGCASCFIDLTTARMLILQNGKYYMAVVNIPGNAGTYVKASAPGLHASDFGLFDFTTGNFNPGSNPNFSSGVMQFGIANRYMFEFAQPADADVRLDNLSINVQSAQPAAPAITAVSLAAGNGVRLSPGAPVTITGSNLGVSANDAATIQIGGKAAPVLTFSNSSSLVAQVPVDLPTGSTTVTTTYKGQSSGAFNTTVDAFAPAIYDPAPSAFTDSSGTAITTTRPAVPGMAISFSAIGLGPTNPPMVTGVKATSQAPTKTPVQVMVGNKMVMPDYAGLLVGSVTDYLVTFKVPMDAPAGNQPVTIAVGGVTSKPAMLSVAPPIPVINAIVNGATFKAKGAAPNSFVSLFGINFGTQDTASNIFPATGFNGVSVLFNGVAAPLYFVFGSAGQINLVLPSELPETGNVAVQVKNPLGTSAPFQLKMAPSDVGLFRIPDPSKAARNNGAVLLANTTWRVMPASMAAAIGFPSCDGADPAATCGQAAKVGDSLQIYLTGMGRATPGGDPKGNPLTTGLLAPADGSILYLTVATPKVTVGGFPAAAVFSGVTPGNAGLYQINLVVPEGVQPGDEVPVVVTMPDGSTDTVTIAVRAG